MRIALLTADARDEWGQYDRPAPVFSPPVEALLEGFAKLPSCEVHIVACSKKPMAAPARIAPNIYYHQLVVPRLGRLRTLYVGCILAMRRKVQELRPDVVHGQGTERYWSVAAALSGFPNVITLHGNMRTIAGLSGAKPLSALWLTAGMEGWVLPRADGVLCISSHTLRLVGSLAKRTWVLPNAVDLASFRVVRTPVSPPEILCVANIQPLKNQLGLLRALQPLAMSAKFKLRFFGGLLPSDPYAIEFKTVVQSTPWCEYGGSVDRAGINDALSRASLLVLPTLEDNCPMVILEAMAAGLPVAASRIGGVPDLINDGVNGLLLDPANPEGMRDAVAQCLARPDEAEDRARVARKHAELRFAPLAVAEGHLEIYRELLNLR